MLSYGCGLLRVSFSLLFSPKSIRRALCYLLFSLGSAWSEHEDIDRVEYRSH